MQQLQQSEATAAQRRLFFHAVDATDGITAETGLTGTGFVSENGATPVASSGSISELNATNMPGRYYIELTAAELSTLGVIEFRYKAAACAEVIARGQVVPWDPYSATNMGLTNIDVLTSSRLAPTTAARTLDILATGEVPIDFDTSIGTLAAAQIEANALDGKGDWNIGKTGYTLTQSFPTNFADLSIVVTTGEVQVGGLNANVITTASIIDGAFTAAKFAAASLNGKGDWNIGKTGYTLIQAFPTNFADMAITITTGLISVGTNNDKAGYSISGAITTLDGLNDFDPTADPVANVTLVATTTVNSDMRGTENAALASVLGALADAAAAGDPTSADTVMQYLKQLINTLEGTVGIPTWPAAVDAGDGVSIAEAIRQINVDSLGLNGDVMRGTDSALPAADINLTGGAVDTVTTVNNLATDSVDAAALAADAVAEIANAILPETNVALSNILFRFVAASDHVTPVTGASTMSVTRIIDGGTEVAGTGTITEVSNGWYQYDASQADMNGGIIGLRFAATGGTPGAPDDSTVTIVTTAGV